MSVLESETYLEKEPPKSLDRDDFKVFRRMLEDLPPENAISAATDAVSYCVARSIPSLPMPPKSLFVCGGGRKNPRIMTDLHERLVQTGVVERVESVEALGFDGDMLEAQAFAFLAVRVIRGLPTSVPGTTGVPTPLVGGSIAKP